MKTADPELMRAINRFTILDTVRRNGPISRVEISERTMLSTTTVSAITASLLDDGLILSKHLGDIRSDSARGRPRVMLEINPDAARVVGAKIAGTRMVFVVTDFCGSVLSSLSLPIRVDRQPISVISDLIEDGVRRCVADANLSIQDIEMVCLGIPGVIEHRTGIIRSSPILKDQNTDFAQEMSTRLGLKTLIESDANAVALAHHWFGQARDISDMVLISLEQNLGIGVLHNRSLFRGAGGLSHNLGDLALKIDGEQTLRLGSKAGEEAILSSHNANSRLNEAVRLGRGMIHAKHLIDESDAQLVAAAVKAGHAIGMTLANIVTLFAPPRVIIVGSSLELGAPFIDSIESAFARAIPESLSGVSELFFDKSNDELWAQGSAAVALNELYESPWSTTGPAF
jgi:predicted NBD/HSP70 family sugar kinase